VIEGAGISMDKKTVAVFCTDVVGYSAMMSNDEQETLRTLDECRAIIDSLINNYSGRIFSTAGDSVLAEFENPIQCVKFAIECQLSLHERNQRSTAPPMRWRMGLNYGEVVVYGANLLGDTVNIGARIESMADYGGIGLSHAVYNQVADTLTSIKFIDRGEQYFKNIPKSIKIWSIPVPGATKNPNNKSKDVSRVERDAMISHVVNDRSAMNHGLQAALDYKTDGKYEYAARILMHRITNRDTASLDELISMCKKKIIPDQLLDYVVAILDECGRFFDSERQFQIGKIFASGVLGDYRSKAIKIWRLSAERSEEAAYELGAMVLRSDVSSETEIQTAVERLGAIAKRKNIAAMIVLAEHFTKNLDVDGHKEQAFCWLWAAREYREPKAQLLLEQLTKKLTRKEVINFKYSAEALTEDISWHAK
jgi:class 3 adenylate cyclase